MKRNRGMSIWDRLVSAGTRRADAEAFAHAQAAVSEQIEKGMARLSGSELENAYRDLLLENQVLLESNERLHDRIARLESGLDESPAAHELISAQRDALVERSRRLRELEYETKNLKREQKKLLEDNSKLAASVARTVKDMQPLLAKEELSRRELAKLQQELQTKNQALLKLTDKYYQLEARSTRKIPDKAANSQF